MRNLLVMLFLFISVGAIAQNPRFDFKYAFKLGNASSLQREVVSVYDSTGNETSSVVMHNMDLFQLVPSFVMQAKSGNLHEFSLTTWKVHQFDRASFQNNQIAIGRDLEIDLAARYGYFFRFAQNSTSGWVPMLGVEATPFYRYNRLRSSVFTIFPEIASSFGLRGAISPRIAWYSKKKFFMDCSLSLNLLDFKVDNRRVFNPTLTIESQKSSSLEYNVLAGPHSMQISAGWRL